MAGGTPEHGRLAAALAGELRGKLRGRPCAVFSSDVRIRIAATDRTTYPDLSVVCGKRETAADDPDALVNPIVIVEVLSDSTEADDRGAKFAHYRRLESLREYVLVSQHESVSILGPPSVRRSYQIVYTDPKGNESIEDALVVADETYAMWRTFLLANGLTER